MSYLASVITNLAIGVHGKKDSKGVVPMDFILEWDSEKTKEPKKQNWEEMKALLLAMAAENNAKIDKQEAAKKEAERKRSLSRVKNL